MEFQLDTSQPWSHKLGLEGVEEILQNVRVILDTPKGTLPLDRNFGIDWSLVDLPTPVAVQKLKAEVVATVERYEPRVKITEIEISPNEDGKLIIRLKGRILSD